MATFAQLCEQFFDELDGRPVQFTTTNLGRNADGELYITEPRERHAVKWIKDAYLRILQYTDQWDFMHKRGEFLRIKAGRTDYTKASYEKIDKDSLYYTRSGSAARTPVFINSYDWWVQQERSTPTVSGSPIYLVEDPDDKWIVWPSPTFDCVIHADWWVKPCEMTNAGDSPVWDEAYHDILVWEALRLFAVEYKDIDTTPQILNRVSVVYPQKWARFREAYLPKIGTPPVFMQ